MRVPVVHIITMLELGGAQQNTLFTIRNLDRDRYRPVLITGAGGLLLESAKSIPDLELHVVDELVRNIRPLSDIKALFRLLFILRKIRKEAGGVPVVVHTHSSKAGILGRAAAWLAGAPVIIHTVHGFGFNDEQGFLKKSLFIFLERVSARVSDRLVAVARDNVDKGVKEGIFREEDAVVIRSGIDTAYFSGYGVDASRKRTELGLPEDAPVVTMISCLKPQKAPVDYVRVAARVLESVPEAHFVHAGDGELRDEVIAEAERLGISGRFHLLGWRDDVRDIIHLSDVIVLTSLWEGLPRVVPQAMAAGKPVVATAVDGTPEAVQDGVSGFLAMPHDVDYMAGKITMLLKDKGLQLKMGKAGRERVAEFDEAKMLKDLCALYERLLKEVA